MYSNNLVLKRRTLTLIIFLMTSFDDVVSSPAIIRNPPLRLGSDPVLLKATVGETARLECPVFSQPQAFISWQKGDSSINHGWLRHKVSGNYLRIKFVNSDDEGLYTCLAVNGFGSVEVKIHLEVVSFENISKESTTYANKTTQRQAPHTSHGQTTTTELETNVQSHNNNNIPTDDSTIAVNHQNIRVRSSNIQPEEIYILVATGLIFFGIVFCMIFIIVLVHLTCGLPCCGKKSISDHSQPFPSRVKLPQYSNPKNVGDVSSSALLLISSSSSLENNNKFRDPTTWSLLDSTTLEAQKLGSLKF